jgi:AcrR family transcriptional regulator
MKKKKSLHSGTADLRSKIIQAALSCFIENGYTETVIGDISKKSETSIGSLYHHFKSKEQLAKAVYIEGIKEYQDGFAEGLNKCSSAKDGISYIVKYHLRWISEYPDWSRFLLQYRQAIFMDEEELKLLNDSFNISIGEWFKTEIKSGKIQKYPPDVYLSILMGPCQEYSRIYLSDKTITDIVKAGDLIASALCKALLI